MRFGRLARSFCFLVPLACVPACVRKKPPQSSAALAPPPEVGAPAPHGETAQVAPSGASLALARAQVPDSSSPPVPKKPKSPRGELYDKAPLDHVEALTRQLKGRIGKRSDKDNQVRIPLPDSRHWKRVRFLGVDHLTGFQYDQEDRHVISSVFVVKTETPHPTSEQCLLQFEPAGLAKFKRHKGKVGPISERRFNWRKKPVMVHETEGRLTVLFSRYEFSAAWAVYPAYDDGCLVVANIVLWDDEPELAREVSRHWVTSVAPKVSVRTPSVPFRKEP